jgi:Ca2+-binding RTX toxin-like protein
MAILSPNPVPAGLTETFTKTGSTTGTPTPTPTPTIPVTPTPVTPVVPTGLTITDTITHLGSTAQPTAYSGPVAGLTSEFISPTADSLNIACTTPGWFIKGGAGNDAIACSSGTNVMDGGTGSNFLTCGSGFDTCFVDDRSPPADIWSTVANCHAGDNITIYGVDTSAFALSWVDGQGAAGHTGLTLHCSAAGKPTASMTLAGFTSADMTSGRVAVSFGTDPAAGVYMEVHIAS